MPTTPYTNPLWAFLKDHDFKTRPHPELKREILTFTDKSGKDFRGGQRVLVESSMWTVYTRHDEKVICEHYGKPEHPCHNA
jgi:hypothetical protein